ncbi:aminotransferase class V-fold PLP-dependent enzyme [Mesobaculum littorinae]|uniref:Aminotransferase class V-fold PLP-dependent enzyme n=1 Tax=Mesobaculum littorinae TaxID=2486419 RepID=A0A438AMB7_9RHOB|nr:aminotransferase class V-fold PLP-dependent enzyme [Mesobaculum littorinae]RVV99898.1 aminotransferase class V-fold PLP-dependent enzyme [Mesobaculum littorinae]
MSLAHGRHYLAIPGPSVMPDRVLQAMHQAAPNIYTGALTDMVPTIVADLKAIAGTTAHCAIYICNGHGTWEASLSNLLAQGDKLLAVTTGRFGINWALHARAMGAEVEDLDFGLRSPADPAALETRLRADTTHEIRAVLASHVDTATGVRNDIPALRAAMDAAGHPALLMVDCVASLGCDPFEMDAWGVDVMIAASQKGLMTPPGLGIVFFSDKAAKAQARADRVTPYWDWAPRANPAEFYQHFGGTAPTHHLFGLRAALDMIGEEGLANVHARHATLARAVWAAIDHWGAEGGTTELNIADPSFRSHAVTAARIAPEHGTRLRDWLTANAGVTLGIGLGMAPAGDPAWHGFFRVGHMGHVNAGMTLGLLASMQAGMDALGIPRGPGALDAAAAVCAAHPGA